jgi:oxygen-independent coproporphyrinogen III oxidase
MNHSLGLYIHIPFCRQRCHFCAFYLEIYREPAAEAFVSALHSELRLYGGEARTSGRPIQSIYFGGGTPTVLTVPQLAGILNAVHRSFVVHPDCEVTLEAHPGTVTESGLSALRRSGVTRLSFGAESMHDAELAGIGRPGGSAETAAAVAAARRAGFMNVSVDVMYGLPGQTVESWVRTLTACRELSPSHLSCYALTVESGTRFAKDVQHDPERGPDQTRQIEMEGAAEAVLGEAGYTRYEISNYAKDGFECRHNLLYWTQGEYLGIGPSAQSFVDGVRFGNIAHLTAYEAALAESRLPVEERTVLSPQERLRDAVIFGLRLTGGIPTSAVNDHAANYGYRKVVDRLRAQKLLEDDGDRTRLSAQGRLHADTVAEQLF